MVIWCSASGSGSRSPSCSRRCACWCGSRLTARLRSGNLSGSRKEHRRVVAHQVPVALLGIELDGKAPDIPFGIGCAKAHRPRWKSVPPVQSLPMAEKRAALVWRVMSCDSECPECARTLGVHAPLGESLRAQSGPVFKVPHVLQQHGTAAACGDHVLVVGTGALGSGGQFGHGNFLRGEEVRTRVPGCGRWVFCYRFCGLLFSFAMKLQGCSHSISPSRS